MDRWEGLEEIVAILDGGSFVAAARTLKVSTSHVSRAVAKLEARLSVQLLNRTTRKVSATPEGAALVEQLRRVLQDRDEVLASLSDESAVQGELRLTCSPALGERYIAPLARRFGQEHPTLGIRLELTDRVVDLIGEGFDIGIRTGEVRDPRVLAHRVGSRRLITCASPGYLQRAGIPESIEALAVHDCLVGTRDRWLFSRDGKPHWFTPKGRWQCNSGAALADAALADLGICQVPLFYVRDPLAGRRLVEIFKAERSEDEDIWAVTPQRRNLAPKVRRFIDLLIRELPDAIRTA